MQTPPQRRDWQAKFRDALRGFKQGVRGQSSFFVHFFSAAVVICSAYALGCTLIQWCMLLLCITLVLTAEMFNSSLESLAKAITRDHDSNLGNALDIASAAVLIASAAARPSSAELCLFSSSACCCFGGE